jgi:Zn-dependent protease
LATAFGIGIYVHWTFLLLPLYIFLDLSLRIGRDVALFAVVGVLCAYVCIVLHELGHALMARRFGIATHDITLLPIGGVARLERMSEKPWEEFWIAVAGPAVNVVIVAALLAVFHVGSVGIAPGQRDAVLFLRPELFNYPLGEQLLIWLLYANLFLVLFNMLPAFPMDGGRVFRALLSAWLGHLRATEMAVGLGVLLAGLFAVRGLFPPPAPLLLIIAAFVFLAGQQELAVVRHRAYQRQLEALGQLPFGLVNCVDPAALPPTLDFSGFTFDRRARVWIEWHQGRPVQACMMQ